MSRILDKSFKYTPSFATDLKGRFERMKREKRAKEKAEQEKPRASVAALPARKASNAK